MHGRLKVPTSEEQKAQKQKERDQKLSAFVFVRDKIWAKRLSENLDEELLSLSAKILFKSPDIYTLWNLRRETIEKLEQLNSENDTENSKEKRLSAELELIDGCLFNNPKSYGAWHHRCWILNRLSQPNFIREIEVCDLALQADERNFHCWDYRRFVCRMAKIAVDKELEFSDRKLSENFSNYSAWHYRSSLLPTVFPDPEGRLALEKSKLETEINFVQNAFFTDPEDSSAWIYHYWLLSKQRNLQTKLLRMSVNLKGQFATILFSSPVRLASKEYKIDFTVDRNHQREELRFYLKCPDGSRSSQCWILMSEDVKPTGHDQSFYVEVNRLVTKEHLGSQLCFIDSTADFGISTLDPNGSNSSLPSEVLAVLKLEVNSCTQLVELEPNNRWPLLNLLFIQRAIQNDLPNEQMINLLEQLKRADKKRLRFYDDLRSRYLIEDKLKMEQQNGQLETLSLNGILTRLVVPAGVMTFVRFLDVSNNQLVSLGPVVAMPNVEVLIADDNYIENFEGLQKLIVLHQISASRNRIELCQKVQMLTGCWRLTEVCLTGNPICEKADECEKLKQLWGSSVSL